MDSISLKQFSMTTIVYAMFICSYCYAADRETIKHNQLVYETTKSILNNAPSRNMSHTLLSHGDRCDNNSNPCETGTICSSDKNNASRCLCNNHEYRTDSNRCLSMKNLLVTDVKTKQIRTNSVELEWLNITFDRRSSRIQVSYDNLSTFDNGNSGAKIYKLKPNTTYIFTIQVVIYSDQWYSERNGPEYIHNARTLTTKNYGDKCNTTTDVCQDETTCVLDSKNISRCLCDKDQYRNDDNKCVTLGELTVNNINVTSIYTNSIQLSWCVTSIKKYSARYRVSYGTHDNVYGNEYGVVIGELQPHTVYTFEVKVVIPPEEYYGVIEGPPNTQTVKTVSADSETIRFNQIDFKTPKSILYNFSSTNHSPLMHQVLTGRT